MQTDRHGLFTELEPPPGGAERFRQRLDETAGPRHAPRWGVFATAGAACAAVVLIAVVLWRDPGDSALQSVEDPQRTVALYAAPEFDRLLGRPPQPVELTVTINERTASVVELETANQKVRIYQIN